MFSTVWGDNLSTKLLKINIIRYFIISCAATVIDFYLSYLLYKKIELNYLFSTNLGMFCGFIFQYFASMKFIFTNNKDINSFVIYIATFLIGLILANTTIWFSFDFLKLSFVFSKMISIVGPFFIIYFIRKKILGIKLNSTKVG
ncbi:GtrA family protein [Wukongibacter sp. M2B1]|uniref:GtrA family protein n=1 Tax=Wukongibacter sp. M2B1 TaxID=3088895 RepID=UPI003D7A7A74